MSDVLRRRQLQLESGPGLERRGQLELNPDERRNVLDSGLVRNAGTTSSHDTWSGLGPLTVLP